MPHDHQQDCVLLKPASTYQSKQGLDYQVGISAESAGARHIHMQLLTIPPGGKGKAHKHQEHETAIYALKGGTGCWYGEALEKHATVEEGDFFYIPAGMPHVPYNPSKEHEATALIARTDPNEQESVTLMPELDALLAERQA
ncbi:cupin domain-containing protein [Pseudomonas viridiflava]|uniref:cupin domain-containing protein n=1 Tax=Pseudomonas viridiflava TaxID=33069 RepID=UPI0018E5AD58|nr:cupin domain-containing protein [Pseudomonas viridiflava]MBI6684262.1 cupin domain-containing protein [Pseudomonas viridiflava]